jgi:DNA-binding NarL/FixJ family response regulator
MVSSEPIRLLVVDADPGEGQALPARLHEVEGIEVVGVARNGQAAIHLAETTQPDVLLVDLMLPDYRSIQVVEQIAGTQPQVRILALSPGDPPHDRIILAIQAGALGYVCRDAPLSELAAALQRVHQGERWLPLDATYEVLRDTAPELAVSAQQKSRRLGTMVLALLPLGGLVAAITAFLWREYWGQIGVRVVDLGVDPATRVTDVLVTLLLLLGVFGPLLFVDVWRQAIGAWADLRPGLSNALDRMHSFHIGKLPVGKFLFNRATAELAMALLILFVTILLVRYADLIVILVLGPAVGIVLLANSLGLDVQLPEVLDLPRLSGRVLAMLGILLLLFLFMLGGEVLVRGPDLRTDGLHGLLAPQLLGLSAQPVVLYDLEGNFEPLGALYLGGNADLYVLYDPCTETVRMVSVGSTRLEVIEQVNCRSP